MQLLAPLGWVCRMNTFYLIPAGGKGIDSSYEEGRGRAGGREEGEYIQHLHFPSALSMQCCLCPEYVSWHCVLSLTL